MNEFLKLYAETNEFPCRHEVYALSDIVSGTDEELSAFQGYFTGSVFTFPHNEECAQCENEESHCERATLRD